MGDDILNPRSLVLPDYEGVDMTAAEKGAIFISSDKIWFVDAVGSIQVVTSA